MKKIVTLISVGAVAGIINGMLGGGGGMLVVPILTYFLGLKAKEAHATAILVILPISVVSAVVYLIGNALPMPQTLFGVIGVVLGGVLGAVMLKRLKGTFIRVLFACFMIVAGIMVV